jgi:hypothetical protein
MPQHRGSQAHNHVAKEVGHRDLASRRAVTKAAKKHPYARIEQ